MSMSVVLVKRLQTIVFPIVRKARIIFGLLHQEEEDICQETMAIILDRLRRKGLEPSDPYIGRTAYFEVRKICKRMLKLRSREKIWEPSKFNELDRRRAREPLT
jgi:hypothetical protein